VGSPPPAPQLNPPLFTRARGVGAHHALEYVYVEAVFIFMMRWNIERASGFGKLIEMSLGIRQLEIILISGIKPLRTD